MGFLTNLTFKPDIRALRGFIPARNFGELPTISYPRLPSLLSSNMTKGGGFTPLYLLQCMGGVPHAGWAICPNVLWHLH